jgi:hypothetical protein
MPRRRNRKAQPSTPPCDSTPRGQLEELPATETAVQEEPPATTDQAEAEVEYASADEADGEEEPDSGAHALPWEVWMCVLASVTRPSDIASFGLTCRLLHAITQTYDSFFFAPMHEPTRPTLLPSRRETVWRQLLGATYVWAFDRLQEHIDLPKVGWKGAYRVCQRLAYSRVNINRLFQTIPYAMRLVYYFFVDWAMFYYR